MKNWRRSSKAAVETNPRRKTDFACAITAKSICRRKRARDFLKIAALFQNLQDSRRRKIIMLRREFLKGNAFKENQILLKENAFKEKTISLKGNVFKEKQLLLKKTFLKKSSCF